MSVFLCVSLIIVGLVLLTGTPRAALFIGLIAVAGGFGYRIYTGEEIRAVVPDAFFVFALLPIGLLAAKQCHDCIDATQDSDSN